MYTPDSINDTDTVVSEHQELGRIAEAALCTARVLMETGVAAKVVREECCRVARGLGARHVDLRSDYASLDVTITTDMIGITRMVEVGPHGVNYRLAHAIRALAQRIGRGDMTPAQALSEMNRLKQDTARHDPWVIAVAVGIACAAFGRLLGMDWPAFLPVATGGTIGQAIRHSLLRRGANIFVVAACIAFLASSVGGLGSHWLGSTTCDVAMIAAVLLLVPGVPALNAQYDILDGHPTLGAARAVVVSMILIFVAIGVLLARELPGIQQ